WQQPLPAQPHQLIVTETRQRSTNPNHHEEEENNLQNHVQKAKTRQFVHKWAAITAKKQHRDNGAENNHLHVLGHKKHTKTHAAVLDVKPGRQLLFRLQQVKRSTLQFGHHANKKDNGRNWLPKYKPAVG